VRAESLREAVRAQPFKPFSLMLADGTRLPVTHPEWILVPPGARTAVLMDQSGRVRILDSRGAVLVWPARLVVPARGSIDVTVSGRRAGPGDHPSLVLFTTERGASDIAVRLRLGVVVLVRGRGVVVHRIHAERVVARAHQLDLWLRNAGNVAEPLRIRLRVGERWLRDSRLILPHARAVATFSVRVAARRAVVEVAYGGRVLRRTPRIRR
jgi:hypothetical protein